MTKSVALFSQTDSCPECSSNQLDLQALTWAKVRCCVLDLSCSACMQSRYAGLVVFPDAQAIVHASVIASTNGYSAIRHKCVTLGHEKLQIATPSPGGGRVNIQFRRVECAPPSDLVIIVDSNSGSNGWIRLKVYVRHWPAIFGVANGAAQVHIIHEKNGKKVQHAKCALLQKLCCPGSQLTHSPMCALQKAGGPAPVQSVQIKSSSSETWQNMNNL